MTCHLLRGPLKGPSYRTLPPTAARGRNERTDQGEKSRYARHSGWVGGRRARESIALHHQGCTSLPPPQTHTFPPPCLAEEKGKGGPVSGGAWEGRLSFTISVWQRIRGRGLRTQVALGRPSSIHHILTCTLSCSSYYAALKNNTASFTV